MPELECDLVMRGGITSGVVYPPAIAALSSKYRFRSIGGASAGAIAAGAAAAAEYGRRRGTNPGAFDTVAGLSGEIGRVLGGLFVPCHSARPAFRLFMLALAYGNATAAEAEAHTPAQRLVGWLRAAGRAVTAGLKALWILAVSYPLQILVGLVPAAFVAAAAYAMRGDEPGWVAFAFVFAVIVLTVVFVSLLLFLRLKKALTSELAATNYGMCSGMGETHGHHGAKGGVQALTQWLHATYQGLAGRELDAPLCFGDLFGPDGEKGPARNHPDIELRVMTTCLTQGRPFTMPFAQDTFWWRPDEFSKLFPASVVAAMQKPEYEAGNGYYKFPRAEDLPILVAIRMSLSFPVLLWAVPLHGIDYTEHKAADGTRPFRRMWFSDGGICSNFPIHFFDSPWPMRPTFGITLDAGTAPLSKNEGKFPQPAGAGILRPFRTLGGVGSFFGAIVDTMKDWQDNLQATLPGYRDRIAVVHLAKGEGGLNLDMDPATVATVAARGGSAGEALLDFNFDDHRWRRHLVWLGQLQRMLASGRQRYGGEGHAEVRPGVAALRPFLETYGPNAQHYPQSEQRRAAGVKNLDELMAVAEQWLDVLDERPDEQGRMRAKNFPHPKVTVRQVPADVLPPLAGPEVGASDQPDP